MPLKLVTGPAREPIHLAEAKLHLKVEHNADDSLILASIQAARGYAEGFTARQLVTATYDLMLDCFPCSSWICPIEVPRPPLQSVISIIYIDTTGITQTLDPTRYIVDTNSEPGRIMLAYGQSWPPTRVIMNAVTIRFMAGHATPFLADATVNQFTALGRTFATNDVLRLWNSGGALPIPLVIDTDYHVIGPSGANFQLASTQGGAAIDITTSGSGTHFAGNVPREILQGILVDLTDLYENRESVVIGTTRNTIPILERLYWPQRIMTF
jgi:uncharacterized phiE125 gp8 family phage protein